MSTVHENIRKRRKQLRYSQTALAEKLGMSLWVLNRIENEVSPLTVERLQELAKALHCEPADLLDPEWDCPPPHPSFGEVG